MMPTNIEQQAAELVTSHSTTLLIDGCLNCIEQCDQILALVSEVNYIDGSLGGASIGAHMRHILDRFHCFFAGLPNALIDYDERKRDPEIESNVAAAAFALATVRRRAEQLNRVSGETGLIAVKEAVLPASPAVMIHSTLERELMSLITHSIHHLAVIVLIAKSFGYALNDDFGKAPSTIAFERA